MKIRKTTVARSICVVWAWNLFFWKLWRVSHLIGFFSGYWIDQKEVLRCFSPGKIRFENKWIHFVTLFAHPFPTISAHLLFVWISLPVVFHAFTNFVSTQKRTKSFLHFSRRSSFLSRISFLLQEFRRPGIVLYSDFFQSAVVISCFKVTSK